MNEHRSVQVFSNVVQTLMHQMQDKFHTKLYDQLQRWELKLL
uniref:Uncharacterized protein n=1 Tax=Labrus bergylta TaxID=56723 RepID=A0A3Q3FAD3_9LABR